MEIPMKKNPKPEAKDNGLVSLHLMMEEELARRLLDGSESVTPSNLPGVVDGQEIACWMGLTKDALRNALAR